MSRGLSLYLDLIRFLAAVIVLLSHFAYPRFSRGDYMIIREFNLGSDAVVLFFVLSGFVIAFCATEKDRDGASFAFNRATRIYSVAIPALVLTFVFDRIGAYASPAGYDGWFYNAMPFWEHMLRGVTFSGEWDWFVARMGTNGPYWSLSYEVAYYALFGIAVYLSGAVRVLLLVAAVLLFGLKVMLLMPAWLLGVWVYHALARAEAPADPGRWWLIAVLMGLLYVVCQALKLPLILKWITLKLIGREWEIWLRFSDEFLWNGLIGLLFAVHIFAVGQALRAVQRPLGRSASAIHWLAGGSFSLYVLHYPLMQMIDEMMTEAMPPLVHDAALLGLVFAGCYGFAQIFERSLPWQRAALQRIWAGRRVLATQ